MRNNCLREDLIVTYITTNARNAFRGHEQMTQHDVGTSLWRVRTLQVREELAACCQQCWYKPHFHGTPQVKVDRIEVR